MDTGNSNSPKSHPPLRFGIVGAGHWAREIHAAVLTDHPYAQLVGVWNRDVARAESMAADHGIKAFKTYDDLLDEVDAVSFAVAPDVQAELATQAAKRGRHLLLEKPLSLSPAAAEQLVYTIKQHKVASVVFLSRCFEPSWVEKFAAISTKDRWMGADAHFLSGALRPGTPYSNSGWRQEHGALWDLGPHVLSVLLPILGGVAAVRCTHEEPMLTRLQLVHASGKHSEMLLGLHAEPERAGEAYVLHGIQGAERLDVELPPAARKSAFSAAVRAVAIAARGGPAHTCNAAFGLKLQRVLAAAEKSLESESFVPIDS
jgi:predicted dehydrogenase